MKYITAETIHLLRQAAPDAVFIGRDNDPCPERNEDRLSIARLLDIITTTGADQFLKTYQKQGIPVCAFIPNPCDPDIQRAYPPSPQWQSDAIFTGKAEHKRLFRDDQRYELLERLSRYPNSKMYGCFGNDRVGGVETFYAISGAKVALSINIVNDERLYHSDRLVNCIACGTFTLSKRVPDSDLLFEDGKHVRYFENNKEFFELLDWYLQHDEEREKIARAGMEHAHREYNCSRMAQHVLDLIEKGSCDAPWNCVLRNSR